MTSTSRSTEGWTFGSEEPRDDILGQRTAEFQHDASTHDVELQDTWRVAQLPLELLHLRREDLLEGSFDSLDPLAFVGRVGECVDGVARDLACALEEPASELVEALDSIALQDLREQQEAAVHFGGVGSAVGDLDQQLLAQRDHISLVEAPD